MLGTSMDVPFGLNIKKTKKPIIQLVILIISITSVAGAIMMSSLFLKKMKRNCTILKFYHLSNNQ